MPAPTSCKTRSVAEPVGEVGPRAAGPEKPKTPAKTFLPWLALFSLSVCCAARADARVVMADDAMRSATVRALRNAESCRAKVHAEFGVRAQPVTWMQGETSPCNDYGPVAGYTDSLAPGRVFLCRAFLGQTRALQTLVVIHEELHALGADDGHDAQGHDYEQRMNARILEVCRLSVVVREREARP